MQSMMGLNMLTKDDLQLAGMADELTGRRAMQPVQQEQGELANELLRMQVADAPATSAAKKRNYDLDAIGSLAQGLSYADPGAAPDVISQLLEKGGHYKQDPEARLKKMAAAMGISVEELKQRAQSILPTQ